MPTFKLEGAYIEKMKNLKIWWQHLVLTSTDFENV